MPHKDKNARRAYMREYMRRHRAEQREALSDPEVLRDDDEVADLGAARQREAERKRRWYLEGGWEKNFAAKRRERERKKK